MFQSDLDQGSVASTKVKGFIRKHSYLLIYLHGPQNAKSSLNTDSWPFYWKTKTKSTKRAAYLILMLHIIFPPSARVLGPVSPWDPVTNWHECTRVCGFYFESCFSHCLFWKFSSWVKRVFFSTFGHIELKPNPSDCCRLYV